MNFIFIIHILKSRTPQSRLAMAPSAHPLQLLHKDKKNVTNEKVPKELNLKKKLKYPSNKNGAFFHLKFSNK